VLALSVSQTGDRTPKDSGGSEPPLQNVQGNHKQRNQQVNLPLFNIEMLTTQMTCKRKKTEMG
jgi:hypothetical protein